MSSTPAVPGRRGAGRGETTHVVDESKIRGLLVAAAVCFARDVTIHRQELRGLLLPRQERLHFNHEDNARRKQIITVIAGFDLTVGIYRADRDDAASRMACLEAIVRDHAATAERLVIERDESTYVHDRRTLTAASHRFGCHDTLRWDLLAPKDDPLLWVPDAVAWCWMRGGQWRRFVEPFSAVREV